MSGAVKRVAQAIRQQDKEAIENQAREIEYADVRRINPLSLELHGSRISLDEDDDLTLSQWVRSYDAVVGIEKGDTLAVKQMRGGKWLVTDVINDEAPLFASSISDGAITTEKLANDSVTAAKIATDAVGASEIVAGAIGSSELADNSITSTKIVDGTITNTDISASAAIAESKLSLGSDAAAGTASRRTLGTGATQACAGNDARLSDSRTPSGSAGGVLSGTFPNPTLADDSVTAAKIAVTYEAQTGATFTPVTGDMGKLVGMNRSTSQTVTIDESLNLSAGDRIDFIQLGAGQVTFEASSTTLNGTPGLKLRAQYSAASIVCIGTDAYVLVGDLSS